jgi:hypothetical protein
LIGFGTDGCLLFWRVNLEEEARVQKIEHLHQSGVNCVDLWQETADSARFLVATVGDDTRIGVLELDIDEHDRLRQMSSLIKRDMAHASCISSIYSLTQRKNQTEIEF